MGEHFVEIRRALDRDQLIAFAVDDERGQSDAADLRLMCSRQCRARAGREIDSEADEEAADIAGATLDDEAAKAARAVACDFERRVRAKASAMTNRALSKSN